MCNHTATTAAEGKYLRWWWIDEVTASPEGITFVDTLSETRRHISNLRKLLVKYDNVLLNAFRSVQERDWKEGDPNFAIADCLSDIEEMDALIDSEDKESTPDRHVVTAEKTRREQLSIADIDVDMKEE